MDLEADPADGRDGPLEALARKGMDQEKASQEIRRSREIAEAMLTRLAEP